MKYEVLPWVILFLPLLAAGLIALFTRKNEKVSATLSVGAIVAIFVRSLLATQPGKDLTGPQAVGDTATLGRMLFTNYLLPFGIVSILLLVAMVGVILLSKKDLK